MTDEHSQPGAAPMVWYACYGSNLQRKRFMCYIAGGTPAGSQTHNLGARNKVAPACSKSVALPHALYFAGYSRGWNGAPAFIRSGGKTDLTYARMYLITYDQFNDVVIQENGRPVDGTRFIPAFEELGKRKEITLPGRRLYSKLLYVQDDNGYPVLTLTTDQKLEVGSPSAAYVRVIAAGLLETYPNMTSSEICAYLAQAGGIKHCIDVHTLAAWIQEIQQTQG